MPNTYHVTNTARARQVIRVLVRHGFGHILDRLNLEQAPGIGRVVVRLRRPRGGERRTTLDRARMALEELGPTFVKLGQLMASRPDLVSPEVARAFDGLKEDVPPFSGEEALAIIDRCLPEVRGSFFATVDPQPAAAASIAQVHFAVLRDGTRVAVKVRRPGIRETVETDINILGLLARLMERYIPEAGVYEPRNVVREFSRSIRREMDFTLEAAGIQRFARDFEGDQRVTVPRVFWEGTCPEVLTVERLEGGIPIDRTDRVAEAGLDPKACARDLMEVFLKQVLEHGFFHGDPHGGNLVFLPGGRIGFMDFGITGQLDRDLRHSLMSVFTALVDFNLDRIVREYLRMGVLGEEVDVPAFKRDLKDFLRPYYGLPLKMLPVGEIISQSLEIALRHRVRIPSDLIMLAKAWLTLEGIVRRLDPDLNLLELAKPFARTLAAEQYRPAEIWGRLRRVAEDYLDAAGSLPQQVQQILTKVVRGKLRIDFHHENLDSLTREMDRSANRLSFSLVISAIIIGSSLIITTDRGFKVLGYPALGVAGFFCAGMLGIWLVVAILRSGRL